MTKNNGLTDEGIAGCWEAIRTYHHDTKLATRSRELLQAELARLRKENEELKVENNCLKAKIVNRQYAYLDPKPSEDGRA